MICMYDNMLLNIHFGIEDNVAACGDGYNDGSDIRNHDA